MRGWLIVVAACMGACSIFVDTSGLTGGAPSGTTPDGGSSGAIGDGGPNGSKDGGVEGSVPVVVKPPPTKWTRIADAPAARHSSRGMFDAKRSVVVIYGGLDDDGRKNDAYEWDGAAWTHRMFPESPERQGFGFAWDAKRNVAILMGGQYMPGDIWELDGTAWTNRGTLGLPNRMAGFSGAYDTKRSRFIGFGGIKSEQEPSDITYAWDGTTLTKLTPPKSPPPIRGHQMAYDEARDRVIFFGGIDTKAKSIAGDTWLFDGTTWSTSDARGPEARSGACLAYDAARQLVVMFGGKHSNAADVFDETWIWDGTSWKAGPKGPPARRSCALAYDAKREQIVLFGGNSGGPSFNDAWTLD